MMAKRNPEFQLTEENKELKRTIEKLRRQVSRLRKQLGKIDSDYDEFAEEEIPDPVFAPLPPKITCQTCKSEDVEIMELTTPSDTRVYHVCKNPACGKKRRVKVTPRKVSK
jgi:hypothetical protein